MSLLKLIPGGDLVIPVGAAVAGGLIASGVILGWNALIENPRLKTEVRIATEARMTNQFFETVGVLTDEADQARIRLRLCTQSGGVYDFETGDCRKR